MRHKILVTGLGRNIGDCIEHNVSRILNAFEPFGETRILVVESDSSDNSIEVLENLGKSLSNFNYISLGNLAVSFPNRLDRISHCRNVYMSSLRCDPIYRDITIVCVVDFDLWLDALDSNAVGSCFAKNDWSAVFANQSGAYYDVFALRAEGWSPNDCWEFDRVLRESGVHPRIARELAVHSRQKRIPLKSPWIPVQSAFGGMALYRREDINCLSYSAREVDNKVVCEHVVFNRQIYENGGKLFINPKFINFSWNDHNIQGKLLVRLRKLFFVVLIFLRMYL